MDAFAERDQAANNFTQLQKSYKESDMLQMTLQAKTYIQNAGFVKICISNQNIQTASEDVDNTMQLISGDPAYC